MSCTSSAASSFSAWGRILRKAVVCAACVMLVSCRRPTEQPVPGGAADGGTFAQLREEFGAIIARFPNHPRSRETLDLLIEAAVTEEGLNKDGANRTLMYRLPDDNIGLYLFDLEYEALEKESTEKAKAFCQEVRERASGTALALAAFDKTLALEGNDPNRFLELCEQELTQATREGEARVALLRRFEFYRETKQSKRAALDALLFMAEYPEISRRMGTTSSLIAAVRNAGFIIEAKLLKEAPVLGEAAQTLHGELARSKTDAEREDAAAPCTAIYWRFAPNLEKMAEVVVPDEPVSFENVFLLARMAAIAAFDLDAREVMEFASAYSDAVKRFAAAGPVSTQDLRRLAACCEVLVDDRLGMFGSRAGDAVLSRRAGYNAGRYISPGALEQATASLFDAWADVVQLLHDRDPDATAASFAGFIDEQISLLEALGNHRAVIACHKRFIDRYPDDLERVPRYWLAMAECYGGPLNAPEEAVEILAALAERYPDSPEALSASMKQGLLLYEAGRYEQAVEILEVFAAKNPENEMATTARFLSALCLAAMGLAEESETAMIRITQEDPQSPVAARALFWLGSTRLSQQAYDKARDAFRDLIERYPESPYTPQARNYVEKLSKSGL